MTEETMKTMLTSITDETDDGLLSAYLKLAGEEILDRLYPFDAMRNQHFNVPVRYRGLQVKIAAYHLNKRGAEGEMSHSENGITRVYELGGTPQSLLREITPYASVPGVTYENDEA